MECGWKELGMKSEGTWEWGQKELGNEVRRNLGMRSEGTWEWGQKELGNEVEGTWEWGQKKLGNEVVRNLGIRSEGASGIVSCPDPTQLTRGEGVWCHKSKSLGQRKYRSLVIVSVDYKFVSVNNEFHNITLSGTIEVLVLASALFQ